MFFFSVKWNGNVKNLQTQKKHEVKKLPTYQFHESTPLSITEVPEG
jgi:hypothetical protein